MANTADAIIAAAMVDLLDDLGVTATYQAIGGGDPETITVRLNKRIEEELSTFERPLYEPQQEIVFDRAEVPTTKKGDTVTIGADVYTLTERTEDDGFLVIWNVKD